MVGGSVARDGAGPPGRLPARNQKPLIREVIRTTRGVARSTRNHRMEQFFTKAALFVLTLVVVATTVGSMAMLGV